MALEQNEAQVRPDVRGKRVADLPSMGMSNSEQRSPELSYLDAARVSSPAGVLADFDVVTAGGEPLGTIAGVVIEAGARCARYFDVQSHGWRRRHYLVKADQLAQVDSDRKELRLLSADVPELYPRTESFRPFSDTDLLAVMFPSRAA